MKLHCRLLSIIVSSLWLCIAGCDDSKNPLSDPKTSKADERLVGVWLQRSGDDELYYHVGHAGAKFPLSVLRIVEIKHSKDGVDRPEEYLAFPTVIEGKTYLNVVWDGEKGQVTRLDEKGWNADLVDSYTWLKYQFDGDKLVVYVIDEEAKQKAIKDGKLKGVAEPNKPARFTDTTENVSRFVAKAGDRLWNTKEPAHFERVKTAKKP